jgi:hypothetical protein
MATTQKAPRPEPISPDPRVPRQYRAGDLIIDHRAQRDINDDRVKQIVNEFDWSKFETPTVVDTKAGPVVIEGQHRSRAVQALDQNLLVWCMLLPDALTTPEQAQLALDIVQGRHGHSAYDLWMNAVHAEHPHEVQANEVLQMLGLRLGRKPSTMTIAAIATVRSIVHGHQYTPEDGAELLLRTLQTVMNAWPTYDHDSSTTRWDRDILIAVANIHRNWWDSVDANRLATVVRVKPAIQWRSIGQGNDDNRPASQILYDRFVKDYNRGMRTRRLK